MTQLCLGILVVLISALFYTLFERKLLSSAHIRMGPVLVGPYGLLQPLTDVMKLFLKSPVLLFNKNWWVYTVSPCLAVVCVSALLWIHPWFNYPQHIYVWPLVLMSITSIGLIPILGASWGSNSPWATLGAVRVMAQTISYEVGASFFFILVFWGVHNTFLMGAKSSGASSCAMMVVPLVLIWGFSALSETNRSPFDFGEAESELVSGFNVEYGGGWFASLFAAEYASMIFLSMITPIIFGLSLPSATIPAVFVCLYLFVWVRCALPRTRYDKLMMLCWVTLLPSVLFVLFTSSVWVYRACLASEARVLLRI